MILNLSLLPRASSNYISSDDVFHYSYMRHSRHHQAIEIALHAYTAAFRIEICPFNALLQSKSMSLLLFIIDCW